MADSTGNEARGAPRPSGPGLWDGVALFVASLAHVGYCPKAPGTAATLLVGVPLASLVGWAGWPMHLAVAAGVFGVSCAVAGRAGILLGERDSPKIVIDEVAGFLVATFLLPVNWKTMGLSFVLFRVFDIAKPWPVCVADRKLGGGFGVTADDVLAGLYSLGLAHGAVALWRGALA